MRFKNSRGFTLLEMMIVIAIGLTMAGVTMMALIPLFTKSHVDRAYDTTLSAIRSYRNLAIAQSNRYILVPTAPGTITVQFWAYVPPPGISPAPQWVSTINLPPDVQFSTAAIASALPAAGPDGIGTPANPIYFANTMTNVTANCNVVEGGQPCVVFYPDGSAQDDAGNYINGVLYLYQLGLPSSANPSQSATLLSSRAIDIWGTTGRVRGWRLYVPGGGPTWYQQ